MDTTQTNVKKPGLLIAFEATRPKFLTASVLPILVGAALSFAAGSVFNPLMFVLALLGIILLHAGANVTNDYFDHTSRNDWVNENVTPFSGGRRFIQDGVLSAKATLVIALVLLAAGAAVGLVIVLLTKSVFIVALGLAGLLGGYFYTAAPLRLGYRGVGEIIIGLLFGILPVYGIYYLQVFTIDINPLLPSAIVAILVFLIVFANEFPDRPADAAVNKRTLVVSFGVPVCVWVYRIVLIASYVIAAAAMVKFRWFIIAGVLYLLTLPMAVSAIKQATTENLSNPGTGQHRFSQTTIGLHTIGCLAMTAGLVVSGFVM